MERARRRSGRSSSPAASASSGTATSRASARRCCRTRSRTVEASTTRTCPTCWPATSRPWCTPPSPTPARRTGCRPGPCTASIGPGSTNMLTGAALATINRLPVLLLPADTFATRVSGAGAAGARAAARRATSPSTTRSGRSRATSTGCSRPEQLPAALLGAMRVLTDPVETGAVTIALPQDVQAEAYDWPVELFAERVWHVARPLPERSRSPTPPPSSAAAKRPLIVAGGGVHYSGAERGAARALRADRHPGRREPGRQGLAPARPPAGDRRRRLDRHDCRQRARRRGRRRHRHRHPLERLHHRVADRVPEPGRPVRQHQRRSFDAVKQAGLSVVADAREALEALADGLDGYAVAPTPTASGRPRCGPSGTPRSRRPTTRRPR